MGRVKKDFDSLTDEAIENIRNDREQTKELLKDLVKYLSNDDHRHKEVGLTAAKYVETLQRSNEQLVKIAALKQKTEKADTGLTDEERQEIFENLNGDVS
jgi:F0F1-type ATP synthase membrane subunit b/b'